MVVVVLLARPHISTVMVAGGYRGQSPNSTPHRGGGGRGVLVKATGAAGGAELVQAGGGGHSLLHQQGCRETAGGQLASHPTGKRHVTKTSEIAFPVA